MEENIKWKNSGEVTTFNKFDILNLEEDTSESTVQEATCEFLNYGENTLYTTYDDFMRSRNNLVDNNINFMYTNKSNFCSGYFPEFITLDNNDAYNLSKGDDYSRYYLYTNNNKYLKQLSNFKSK